MLYVTDRDDAPFRYRCVHARAQLRASGARAEIARLDDPGLPDAVAAFSVLVLFRLPWSDRVAAIVAAARRSGTPIVFDVDDLVFTPEAEALLPFLARMPAARVAEYRATFRGLQRTLHAADACVVTTEALARRVEREGKPALVHPNLLSDEYVALSRVVVPLRHVLQRRPLLAYFSGSNTHDGDLESIVEPLAAFLAREPEFALVLCGHLEPPRALRRFDERVVRIPYQHRLVYPWLMARARAVLAPIETVNDFTNGKSPLKVFEAGVFGVPVVASPTEPYVAAIEDGASGYVAASTVGWTDALSRLVDRGRADALGRRAREIALARFAPGAHRGALARLLLAVAAPGPRPGAHPLARERRRLATSLRSAAGLARGSLRMAVGVRPIAHPWIAPLVRSPSSRRVDASHAAVRRLAVARSDRRVLLDGDAPIGALLCDATHRLDELPHSDDVLPAGRDNAFRSIRGEAWFALESWPHAAGRPRFVLARIRARAASAGAEGKVYWAPPGEGFSEARCVAFPLETDGEAHTYLVRLDAPGGPGRARVGALRLDPIDRPGEVEVVYAAVLARSGRAWQGAALRTAIAARFPGGPRATVAEVAAEDLRRAVPGALHACDSGAHVVLAVRPSDGDGATLARTIEEVAREAGGSVLALAADPRTGEHVAAIRRDPCEGRDDDGDVPVDIVVPIYNAPQDTRACIESVLRHAKGDFRLVLVNDASPDPAIAPLLAQYASDPRVVVLTNDRNLGFVGTANRGMRAAGARDVLLLNSDTEVFERFLTGIRAAAYAQPDTGIVTPFSNNATICSIPEFPRENAIPDGFTAASFAALVAACSLRRRPELVTGVGFCMYVKRAVLDRVGDLDEATFGRGFGEENDLCQRARKAGFTVRLCDDVFVWHKGKASFGADGHALDQKNAKLLEAKHPGYHAEVAVFIETNPLHDLHENVRFHLHRRRRGAESAMLFVLHASPFAAGCGGTEHHVRDLVRALRLPRAVIAYPTPEGLGASEVLEGAIEHPTHYRFPAPECPRFAIAEPEVEAAFAELVDTLDVRSAHLHHLMWWPLRLGEVLRQASVPYLLTAHDYYAACPNWNLYDYARDVACDRAACADPSQPGCLPALFELLGDDPGDLVELRRRHRAAFVELIGGARGVVFPSAAALDVLRARFPLDPSRVHVIPHGMDLEEPGARPPPGDRLRVAVLGEVAHRTKGAERYLELIRATRDVPIAWHFFGPTNRFGYEERLRATGHPALFFHGRYMRDGIAVALAREGIEVGVLLPSWPETFSYVLSELFIAGIPAVVSDLGAPADRVRRTGAGVVVHSTDEAAAILRAFASDRASLAPLADLARRQPHRSVADSAREHRELYSLLGMLPTQAPVPPLDPAKLRAVAARRLDGLTRRSAPPPRSLVRRTAARVKPFVPAPVWSALRSGWHAVRR